MTRRLAYDLEFIEGVHPKFGVPTIDLVSIGMVNVDSTVEQLHLVSAEFDLEWFTSRPWLVEHVAPWLPWQVAPSSSPNAPTARLDPAAPEVMTRGEIAARVLDFIVGPGEPVELWADWGAYDHVALCALWGGMAEQPPGVPMFTHDLQQRVSEHGIPGETLPQRAGVEHKAIDDALHLAACVRATDGYVLRRLRPLAHEPGS